MENGGNPKYEFASNLHQTNYFRNSKAIGVLWGVFTICYAIINIVVFIQPHWIGDTLQSRGTGHFGLWQYCRLVQDGQDIVCDGRLDNFATIPSPAFRASTVFVGLSVIIVLLCIFCMILFLFFHSSTVFHICGWMQVFSAMCMVIGVLTYPAGWGAEEVREVCGSEAESYDLAQCGIRWAFILAIIGICDCITLAALAFVLGTRYVKLLPEQYVNEAPPQPYKGDLKNGYISDNHSVESRKSMTLKPVMLMPPPGTGMNTTDPDRFSQYSQRSVAKRSSRLDYAPAMRNFQL